jgi:hypothetical protein
MKTTMVMVAFASLGFAACDATVESGDDLENVQIGGLDDKSDSLFYPTEMGELQLLKAQTQNLAPQTSGYQVYTFWGRQDAEVKFVEKSGQFRTYLRVYAPSGRRWSRSGVRNLDNGAWYSTLDLTLPENGTYVVLATSYDNMHFYPYARTTGEYTLSADGQWFCGGMAPGMFPCPSHLKCLLDGSYPDAGGQCALLTACHAVTDCDGLAHPYCPIGPNGGWQCNADGRDAVAGVGSCSYACGGF